MDISIVILTLNEEETIGRCLKSITSQITELKEVKVEIIVVDGESTDKTKEIVGEYDTQLKVIPPNKVPPYPIAHARNVGWKMGKGRVIAYVSGDAIPERTWLEGIIQAFSSSKDDVVGVFGAIIPLNIDSSVAWCLHKLSRRYKNIKKGTNRVTVTATNVAYRKDALEKSGGFDENLFSEDGDISFRLSKKYKIIYEPKMVVKHRFEETFTSLFKKTNREVLGYLQFIKKHKVIHPFFFRIVSGLSITLGFISYLAVLFIFLFSNFITVLLLLSPAVFLLSALLLTYGKRGLSLPLTLLTYSFGITYGLGRILRK